MSTVAEVQELDIPSPLVFTDNAAKKVKELNVRRIRLAPREESIKNCAEKMAKEQVSCLFIGESVEKIEGYIRNGKYSANLEHAH